MQTHTVPQPTSDLAMRLLLAVPVAVFLAGVVTVATLASHDAVDRMAAQIHPGVTYVQLSPVQVVARRALAAVGVRPVAARSDAPAGCAAPTPLAG